MPADYKVACSVKSDDPWHFEIKSCRVVDQNKGRVKHFYSKLHFPCSSEVVIKTIPRSSTVKIDIEPNLWKTWKFQYVGKELPTKFVATFPNHPDKFYSTKDIVSSIEKNSQDLVMYESLRRRSHGDRLRDIGVRTVLKAIQAPRG